VRVYEAGDASSCHSIACWAYKTQPFYRNTGILLWLRLTPHLGLRPSRSINPQKVHSPLARNPSSLPFPSTGAHKRPSHTTHRRALSAKSRVHQRPCREVQVRRANRRDARKRQRRRAHRKASSSTRPRALECRDVRLFWAEADGCLQHGGSGCAVSASRQMWRTTSQSPHSTHCRHDMQLTCDTRRGMAVYAGRDVNKLKNKGGKWKYVPHSFCAALSFPPLG
jgi:hypothetical protein